MNRGLPKAESCISREGLRWPACIRVGTVELVGTLRCGTMGMECGASDRAMQLWDKKWPQSTCFLPQRDE